jgi:hypothetical protein
MSLVGVKRIDDEERPIKRRAGYGEGNGERKVINVDAELVEEVNEFAGELEDRFGFKPTFAQALRFILKELRNKKL